MANFLGAAFGFGAMDVGLDAALGSATQNLDKINNLLDDQDKKTLGIIGSLKKFNSSFSRAGKKASDWAAKYNVASIAGDMRSLTGETGNLSNSLESMAVSYAQAAKPIVASMDLTGKEAQKMTGRITGMAIGLNVGAEGVAETLKSIRNAGAPAKAAIDAMAMSEKDWVKVTQTTQVTMEDYAALMGDMVASWGASPKQAGAMVDNIMAIGKAAKIGTSAIKGAKGQLDALDAIFEQLPPSMARTAEEVQSLMESTYKLAGAFREMGETEEQATQLGQDTAKMFADQAVMIDKLYAMGGDQALDDSPLFKFLTMIGVGTNEARDIISTGSKDVVSGVSKINDIFAQMGGDSSPQVQFALSELNKAMGQSAAGLGWLASNTDTGTKSLAAMAAMTVKGEGALKKYGQQAFSTGRTLQDSFDLAKEKFDTQIRRIGRKDVKKLASTQMGAYREVGNEIRDLGSDETWGPLVNKLSIFKQMGLKGVMLDVAKDVGGEEAAKGAAKFGVGLDTVLGVAKDLGDELGPAMEILGKFGPMGMAAGGLAGWFAMSKDQRAEIQKTIQPLLDWIGRNVSEQFDGIFSPEKMAGIVDKAGSLIGSVIDKAVDWGKIGKNAFSAVDWDGIANRFVAALGSAFKGTVFGTVTGLSAAASNAAATEAAKSADQHIKETAAQTLEAIEKARADIAKRAKEISGYEQRLTGLDADFFAGNIDEATFASSEGDLLQRIAAERQSIEESGELISEMLGRGIKGGASAMAEDVTETLGTAVVPQLPQSPPLEGPLAGSFLTDSGYDMLMLIGDGIQSAETDFGDLFSQVLEDSVIDSLEAYGDTVEEWSKKKSIMRSVAKQIVQDFGGALELGSVQVEGATLDAKETFEAALDVPGLAGVIAAISSDGHKTRVLLKKIWEDTHAIAESDLVKRTRTDGGALTTLPS